MLRNPAYIGVFIWNKTRREYDLDKEAWVVVKNPRSEWEVHYDPSLALISKEWWRKTQRKLAASRLASKLTGRKKSRNQNSASTLFSGTLFCSYCGRELVLYRSTSKYRVMGCINGQTGTHGCQLSTSKSTRIIEECLLRYLRDTVLTEDRLEALVAKANEIAKQEARKPRVDTAALKAEARKKQVKIDKLILRIEAESDETLCISYDKRVKALQKELNGVNAAIAEAELRRRERPKPLSLDQAKAYLAEFRKSLGEEVPLAAEAIRNLTGPIMIRQEPIVGRKTGARWIATFGADLVKVVRLVGKEHSNQSILVLGDDSDRPNVEVPIEKIPKYEQLAPEFQRLSKNGMSTDCIASLHKMSWKYADEILHFAKTGERPQWRSGKRTGRGQSVKYKEIAEKVARLHERQKMSFVRIAKKLRVGRNTARRAYDHARPEAVRQAAERGEIPHRGSYSHLGEKKLRKIRALLQKGGTPKSIAAEVDCSRTTVCRLQRQMREASH